MMRSVLGSFLGWKREVRQKGQEDKVKIHNEIKVASAVILPMKWLNGIVSGTSTEELHSLRLEELTHGED